MDKPKPKHFGKANTRDGLKDLKDTPPKADKFTKAKSNQFVLKGKPRK